MKVHCHDCQYSKPLGCNKNSKNGYNNCKKFKAIPMEVLKKERDVMLRTGSNPEREKYLTEKLINFNGGTI